MRSILAIDEDADFAAENLARLTPLMSAEKITESERLAEE